MNERAPRDHHLKTWPLHFHHIVAGNKPYDFRQNDRDFQLGDYLILEEYVPGKDDQLGPGYTGNRYGPVRVNHILDLETFGIPGFVIMTWGPWIERNVLLDQVTALLGHAQRQMVQQTVAALAFAHMGRQAAFKAVRRLILGGRNGAR